MGGKNDARPAPPCSPQPGCGPGHQAPPPKPPACRLPEGAACTLRGRVFRGDVVCLFWKRPLAKAEFKSEELRLSEGCRPVHPWAVSRAQVLVSVHDTQGGRWDDVGTQQQRGRPSLRSTLRTDREPPAPTTVPLL